MTTLTTYGAIAPTNDDPTGGFAVDTEWDDIPSAASSANSRAAYPRNANAYTTTSATAVAVQPAMRESLAQRRADAIRRCTDAAKSVGRRLLFGMTTSLALHCVPIPDDCDLDTTVLHTVASDKTRRTRASGNAGNITMTSHLWQPLPQDGNTRINRHVYALDLFHTWAQLSVHLPLESLVVLGDAIITVMARQAALAQGRDAQEIHRELTRFTDTLPKYKGKRACRTASSLIRFGSDSPPETRERLSLLRHGLPDMVLNYVVEDALFRSGVAMTLDMAWPEYRVAIEYDGDHHRTDRKQWKRDQEKRNQLQSCGWLVFIATGATLANETARAEFALKIARALASRGAKFTFHVLEVPLEAIAKGG
ncbi:endonuclease domain-containing protein [Bifidobacterium callitrichos]|nr:hypothetical protein [Bifidobacterium callitrichos]